MTGVAAGTAVITGKWSYNSSKTVTYTVNVTEIPSGTYFILNRQYKKYIQPDNDDAPNYSNNGGIMEQMDFDGGDYQRWIFTHTGDGYYKITSKKSGYAITVPSGEETASGANLVLKNYTGTDNQKWLITATDAGYRISAKCAGAELVMAVEASDIGNLLDNLNIQQKTYVDNDSYKDEWWLHRFNDASLMAIEDTSHSTPHNDYFQSVHNSLSEMGYTNIGEYYDDTRSYDGEDLLFYLCSSSVLTLMTHGAPTEVEMSGGTSVSFWDVMDLAPNSLSDLELVVLASCYTGQGYPNSSPPQNFAEALAAQGAQNVIAFRGKVACAHVIPWMETFFASLADGKTYEQAFSYADAYVSENIDPFKENDDDPNDAGVYTTNENFRVYIH